MVIGKLILSGIIVICSALIGLELSNKYSLRIRELRDFQLALARLETEILHYSSRLPEAMQLVGESVKGDVSQTFIYACRKLKHGDSYTVAGAWSEALDELKGRLHIESEDYEILHRLGEQMGKGDKEGQKKYIDLAIGQLSSQEEKALEAGKKYGRMYKNLGILCGLAIAIILY